MSVTSREIGTLIVVVLKAKNLPNKRHIGKQAPYCLITHNDHKRRTRVIKRGGQHPEWDEEFRFTIYEDMDAEIPKPAQRDELPPPLPPKRSKGPKKIKGGCLMKLQCYADDVRDPDFIGETLVDLTEALTKGETDEWFTLMNKDKYAGEVYLELTFWSNEPPPEKRYPQKPKTPNRTYGGPGSFMPVETGSHPGKISDVDGSHLNSLPSSLRSSVVRPELYSAPYERNNRVSVGTVDHLAEDLSELGMMDSRRRESYPPANHTIRPSTSASLSSQHSYGPDSHGQINISDFVYDVTNSATNAGPPRYHTQYENATVSGHTGPRYSMPSTSSGFVPVSTTAPTATSYGGTPPYSSESHRFNHLQGYSVPPLPPPPPSNFQSQYLQRPTTGHTSAPTTSTPLVAPNPPTAASHRISQFFDSSHSQNSYQQYSQSPDQIAVPFPSHSNASQEYFNGSSIPPPLAPAALSTPPQVRTRYASTSSSPPREHLPPAPFHNTTPTGSRPLPQPGQSQRDRRKSVAGFISNSSYPGIPPALQYHRVPSTHTTPPLPPPPVSHEMPNIRGPPLPNPHPEVQGHGSTPPRPALPQLPAGYPKYPPLPPPPSQLDISLNGQMPPTLPSSSFENLPGLPMRGSHPHTNYWQMLPPSPLPADWQ
ncbi:hypothetical protein EDD17DRAFT_307535 [Pisolithus thermaeus]|nr:hypothetical protein EDD17DRAFT_307535 [Pisolithus thermaeus]